VDDACAVAICDRNAFRSGAAPSGLLSKKGAALFVDPVPV
jgi:hypothetical protein